MAVADRVACAARFLNDADLAGGNTFQTHFKRRLPKIGLFCKRALKKRLYSAKKTYKHISNVGFLPNMLWGGYD